MSDAGRPMQLAAGVEGPATTESPDPIETLVAARIIFDPDDMFRIWRSAMIVPAALMAECFQFACHRMLAPAAFVEGVAAQDWATEALDAVSEAADSATARPETVDRTNLAA